MSFHRNDKLKTHNKVLASVFVVLILVLLTSWFVRSPASVKEFDRSKPITVAINYNSSDYFLRKGFVDGFSFNLTNYIADEADLALRLVNLKEIDEHKKHFDIDIICFIDKDFSTPNGFVDIDMNISNAEKPEAQWVVNKHNDSLILIIQNYFNNNKKSTNSLYRKFFIENSPHYDTDFNCYDTVKISSFDEIIKKHSKHISWDWRLLAALIHEESNFIKQSKSQTSGAVGLMQVMPDHAEKYGLNEESNIESNINAGVKLIKTLDKILEDSIKKFPIKKSKTIFTIASYNAGVNYVFRMREIALQKDLNPNLWFGNVEEVVLERGNEVKQKHNNLFLDRNRALQVTNYVEKILYKYQHYKNLRPNHKEHEIKEEL
jgi:hypothetical protein